MDRASGRAVEVEVPGRVCLFGEHSDWAGSYRRTNSEVRPGACIVIGTDQTLRASACEHADKLIITSTCDDGTVSGPWECKLEEKALLEEAQKGGFWSYAAGVAYQIMIYYPVKGLRLDNHTTTLPMKKGLSSSAAFCVLVSRAFNMVYDLRMTVRAEMELAYLGEILTPSRCGRMDQCCAFGKIPTLMKFDGPLLQTTSLARPAATLYLVIVDLAASKDTKEILACLNKAYPFPSNEVEEGVQRLLGPINEEIIDRACKAIHDGDAEALGALMSEAQRQFDALAIPACPQQLTSPVLHSVLTHAEVVGRTYGAKGVGSQGDGCAQMVAKSQRDQEALLAFLRDELHMRPFPLTLGGAPPVQTCVILAADAPASLYPSSLVSPTSLFPVTDTDGVAKPLVLIAAEAALAAGLDRILVVVPARSRGTFEALFSAKAPSPHLLASLPAPQQAAARSLQAIAGRVELVALPPDAPSGGGHALLACSDAVSGEGAVAVIQPERLFRAKGQAPMLQELLEAYDGTSLLALVPQREEEVGRGVLCVRGQRAAGEADPISLSAHETLAPHLRDGDLLRIDALHSRSASHGKERRDSIEQPGLEEGRALTVGGSSVLSASVLGLLRAARDREPAGELGLGEGLERLAEHGELLGRVFEGAAVEISDPAALLSAASLLRPPA